MPGYFGADDTAAQLAAILAAPSMGVDDFGADEDVLGAFGLDDFGLGADPLEALAADALAADMLFGADPTPANAKRAVMAKTRLNRGKQAAAAPMVRAQAAVKSAAMQNLTRQAMARQAGQVPFSTVGEDKTNVKNEMLPIPPTVIAATTTQTIAVRPTRSMQINSVIFPSLLAATAGCRLLSVQILGQEQMNGPGGCHCAGLTEVRTSRVLKGSTAQAGQDILVQVQNTTAGPLTIEGWFEGPDLVRNT